MPYNGSGTFTPSDTLQNGTTGDAAEVQAIFDDICNGLSNAITRDGQGKPSADIDLQDTHKLINVPVPSAPGDAVPYAALSSALSVVNRKNLLLNGDFSVWQSGAGGSATIAGTTARKRTADCWWGFRTGSVAGWTATQVTGTFGPYGLKFQRDNGNASTAVMNLAQSLETVDCVRLARSTTPLVFSIYIKSGANYSGGNVTLSVIRGTGTNQNVLDGYTGASTLSTNATAITSTLTRYSIDLLPDSSTNELAVQLSWTPSGVAGADDSITVECAQLENIAEPYTTPSAFEFVPFGETLARCQRYYQKNFPYGTLPQQNIGTAYGLWPAPAAGATAVKAINFPLLCQMRTTIDHSTMVTTYNPAAANTQARNMTDGVDCSAIAGYSNFSDRTIYIDLTQNAGATAGELMGLNWQVADPNF